MEARIYKSKDKDGNEVELAFKKPNQVVLTRGDFVYREYFSKAIRSGVMTNAEALKILKDRDVWTEEQDKESVELQLKLIEAEERLKTYTKRDSESLTTYDEIKKLRREINQLNRIRSNVLDNTAESMATEMRTQFFASECSVYNSSGAKVFADLQDFLGRLDEPLATDSYRQALISNYEITMGIDLSDADEKAAKPLPEDEWLNKLREEDEKAAKPKKKTKRKRTTRKKTASK